MLLYHGSEHIIEKPIFGKGKIHNDYGPGFYCTRDLALAKEWATNNKDERGYANIYDFDSEGLNILDLQDESFTILHWLSILLDNRVFRLTNDVAIAARDYIISNFHIDTKDIDMMIGWRADDSYFSFAEDFLNNVISLQKLSNAMRLGNLGLQYVLLSKKAFARITYKGYEEADQKFKDLRTERDNQARESYRNTRKNISYDRNDLYAIDIIRDSIGADDERLQ